MTTRPVAGRPFSGFTAHTKRTPPSVEPGSDYYCEPGTPVAIGGDGVVTGVGGGIMWNTGRYVEVTLDNGDWYRDLHLSSWGNARIGLRVTEGQDDVYLSGASGYGREDWRVDDPGTIAHVHRTYRKGGRWGAFADFEGTNPSNPTAGTLAGGNRIDLEELPMTIATDILDVVKRLENGRSERGQVLDPGFLADDLNAWGYERPEGGVVRIEKERDLRVMQAYVLGTRTFNGIQWGIINYYRVNAALIGGGMGSPDL